jgi:hypothetical protein
MFRAVLALWLFASPLWAEDNFLVKIGSPWRVQRVDAEHSQPAPNWHQLDYADETTWPLLPSGFSSLLSSVPGAAERSHLPVAPPTTYCFRKTFQIADPAFIRWLTLRVDYQNGFVAYLNGREIARRGFPAGSGLVPLTASAAPHLSGPTELIDVSHGIAQLQPGANVLAIQLHDSFDVNTDLRLVAELAANFTRGPYVQNTSTNSTIIGWQTQRPTTGFVQFGKSQEAIFTAFSPTARTNHAVKLTNLEAGQTYQYRVFMEDDGESAASDWATFRALKSPGQPITFFAFGDSGQATGPQFAVAAQMAARAAEADLTLHLGDIIYPGFNLAWVDARCYSIYRDLFKSVPFFTSIGNHDDIYWMPGTGRPGYLEAFNLPTNSLTGTEVFYSFDHGDAHFVSLALNPTTNDHYTPGSPLFQWLEADLRDTRQKWKILFFHYVIRSTSIHSMDDYDFANGLDKLALQVHIGGLSEKYGVQFIFNGHDHDYERFAAFGGYNSFVSGGGGATLYGQYAIEPGTAQFQARHHFLRVKLDGGEATVEAIDSNGIVFDKFHRSMNTPEPRIYTNAWATPSIESVSGNDAAGNITGQTFNFAEPSIRTRAGLTANLGRLHLANDLDFLYVGLEQASIHENQVIALFIENPQAPGVVNLGALGNNQLDDTNGPGVDGLDLLQKLAFKNFAPSIGCLLGDEFADGNFRQFKRPKMRWPAGQGVFRLDASFSNVPGARLQQFDRSPQGAPSFIRESSADLIEIAIPLSELGNPSPGGEFRLGAVVFGDDAEGPMEPAFDTAVAGLSLEAAGDGRVILEPITARLAVDPNPFGDVFRFRGEIIAPDKIRFKWFSTPGAVYSIHSTLDLLQPFVEVPTPGLPATATENVTTLEMTVDPAATPRFFRLRAH